MGNYNEKMTHTLEIDNFSHRNTPFTSPLFSSGSGNWFVTVYPKGTLTSKNMSMYLYVPDPLLRPRSWARDTWFRFVVVNQSSVLKSKSFEAFRIFDKGRSGCGFTTDLCLSKLQEKKFLVNDKLKIEVHISVSYNRGAKDPYELPEKKNEMVNVNGFQVLDSQVKSANWIFTTYPETALHIHPRDPQVKTAYMNILLTMYEKLYNSPLHEFTDEDLANVFKGLLDLRQAGFKMGWLRKRLEKVFAAREKLSGLEAQARELGKQLKDLKLQISTLRSSC
ncbi:unnamed protein product [Thlaspi arvense]|uniref:MATH domain-containing protein n=1 Tax=Thlaspi arvense TaxID=13288 RepID=A0AAU9S278_THLAR|nr:unnamed protein product [Thlaspi arvense]